MSRAAKRAPSPVRGVVGSKLPGAAAEELVEDEPGALLAALGFVFGLVCFDAQVKTPLTMELDLSFWSCVQSNVLLEVWTFRPPRTSLRAGREALRNGQSGLYPSRQCAALTC